MMKINIWEILRQEGRGTVRGVSPYIGEFLLENKNSDSKKILAYAARFAQNESS
jgi:hypothetical protein